MSGTMQSMTITTSVTGDSLVSNPKGNGRTTRPAIANRGPGSAAALVPLWKQIGKIFPEWNEMGARNDQIPASSDYDRIIDAFQRMIPSLVLMNDRVAKKFDLLAVDMQVLHIIALSSSPVTPSAIAETSDIPPSSIPRIHARLEPPGFIRRAPHGFDPRRPGL